MSDDCIEGMDSLEERVSVFFYEHSDNEFNRCVEYDDQSDDDDDSVDSQERALYWESQHSLLQVIYIDCILIINQNFSCPVFFFFFPSLEA